MTKELISSRTGRKPVLRRPQGMGRRAPLEDLLGGGSANLIQIENSPTRILREGRLKAGLAAPRHNIGGGPSGPQSRFEKHDSFLPRRAATGQRAGQSARNTTATGDRRCRKNRHRTFVGQDVIELNGGKATGVECQGGEPVEEEGSGGGTHGKTAPLP